MNKNRWTTSLLAGFAVAGLAGLVTNAYCADTTNLISNTTFEDAVYDDLGNIVTPDLKPRWPWAYYYQWGYSPDPAVNPVQDVYYRYPEIDPTNTLNRVLFDTANYVNPPAGSGFGQGFGAGMAWGLYDPNTVWPTNLQYYIMSFDARVEGLKPGVTSVWGEMQSQFDVPAGTIQPPPATDPNRVIQVNKGFALTSNWTHYAYLLNDETSIGGGKEEYLAQYGTLINSANYNLNIHMPSDGFDYDSDNYVYIDNIKLEVINSDTPPPPPPPVVPYTISYWNMDDQPVWWGYSYSYTESGASPVNSYNIQAAGYGVGGGNAWILTCDNSVFSGQTLPAWAGVGVGGEGAENMTLFNTTDLASYRVTFDSRVEGLAPDVLGTACRLQLLIRAPDDTLQPPDSNTDGDTLLRLDFDVPAQTNWTTTSYLLSKGSVGGGSKANLTNYLSVVNAWRPQWQIENPTSEATWGFDADNVLIIDNIKLERLMVGCPPLNIQANGTDVTVTWASPSSGTVQLQAANSINGTWQNVATSNNTYTVPATQAPKFFRTAWVPPQ